LISLLTSFQTIDEAAKQPIVINDVLLAAMQRFGQAAAGIAKDRRRESSQSRRYNLLIGRMQMPLLAYPMLRGRKASKKASQSRQRTLDRSRKILMLQ